MVKSEQQRMWQMGGIILSYAISQGFTTHHYTL